jgi:Uma2 family endonuclease
MNEHLRQGSLRLPSLPATTQAADGMPRRCWSIAEIEAMVEARIISEDERFELIGGEVVPMSPKGARHEWVKALLNRHFQRIAADEWLVIPETTLRLDEKSYVEPDFCVFSHDVDLAAYNGSNVLLAVEVADSSLAYDLGRKIGVYAAYGVREVWVVNAVTLITRIHRRLGADGYGEIVDIDYRSSVTARLAPGITMTLADLGISPQS